MTVIQIAYKVITEDRDDHWAAQISELGTTLYGATEEEAITRVHGMMEFVVSTFKDCYSRGDLFGLLGQTRRRAPCVGGRADRRACGASDAVG